MNRIGEIPEGLRAYKRTPTFTEATVPDGLLRDHHTKAGVWGVIHVESGQLAYVVPGRQLEVVLDATVEGVVVPRELHHVRPIGAVKFYVEFWK